MENLVSFKVYLNKSPEEGTEVRRLGIEQDVAASYSYFIEKLKTVFPCLQNTNYPLHLYWKDSDSDEVAINSDAELIIALTEMNGPLKKIFIKAAPEQENVEASEVHLGVVCDGCDGVLIGFRYKCVQCPDFDLCSNCEGKHLHPEHLMLRIPTPQGGISGVKVCACSGKKRGKCCCDANTRGAGDVCAENPFMLLSRKHGKKHYYKHYSKKLPMECPIAGSVAKSLADTLMHVSRSAGARAQQPADGCGSTSQEGPCHKRCKRTAAQCNSTNNLSNGTTNPDSSTASAGAARPADSTTENNNDQPQPRNLIEDLMTVAFDCLLKQDNPVTEFINDIISENIGKNNRSTGENNDSSSDTSAEGQPENVEKINNPVDVKVEKTASSDETVKNAPDAKVKNEKTNALITIVNNSDGGVSSTRLIEIETADFSKLVNGIEKMVVNDGADEAQPSATAEPGKESDSKETQLKDDGIRVKAISNEDHKEVEGGWTVLNSVQQTEESGSKPENTINSTGAIPKTTVNTNAENSGHQLPTNENTDTVMLTGHVSDSLRRMLAMGFTNEGNWLGDLLSKNNGDVAAVLDLLLPAKRNAF